MPSPTNHHISLADIIFIEQAQETSKKSKTRSSCAAKVETPPKRPIAGSNGSKSTPIGSMQHRKSPRVETDEDDSSKIRHLQESEEDASSIAYANVSSTSKAPGPEMGIFKLPKHAMPSEGVLSRLTQALKVSNALGTPSTSTEVFSPASFKAFKHKWYQYTANQAGTPTTPTDVSEALLVDLVNAYTPIAVLTSMDFAIDDLATKQYAVSTALLDFHKAYVSVLGSGRAALSPENEEELENMFEGVIETMTNAGVLGLPVKVNNF